VTTFRLEAGLAPGGLVFVLYDVADRELERVLAPAVADRELELAAERHAASTIDRGGLVRVYDGDSGEIVAAIGTV
jgi:hypothetical protein